MWQFLIFWKQLLFFLIKLWGPYFVILKSLYYYKNIGYKKKINCMFNSCNKKHVCLYKISIFFWQDHDKLLEKYMLLNTAFSEFECRIFVHAWLFFKKIILHGELDRCFKLIRFSIHMVIYKISMFYQYLVEYCYPIWYEIVICICKGFSIFAHKMSLYNILFIVCWYFESKHSSY